MSGYLWSQAIPFKALAGNPVYRKMFMQSVATASQNMRPDGPIRTAQAQLKGKTWLRWGEGTAPLILDVAHGWPYRMVVDRANGAAQATYRWTSADTSKKIAALPNEVQKIETPDGAWCTWFTVTGFAETRPYIADGRVPRIRWMLWRPSGNEACI